MSGKNIDFRIIAVFAIFSLIFFALLGIAGCQSSKTVTSDEKGPKILFFSSDTWPACVEAKPLVQQAKDEYQSQIPFVDCDSRNPDTNKLAAQYGIAYVPTLVFIDKNGKVTSKLIGTIERSSLTQNIEKLLGK
jgi:thiol-disulfide isomerase/thioredoxin